MNNCVKIKKDVIIFVGRTLHRQSEMLYKKIELMIMRKHETNKTQ